MIESCDFTTHVSGYPAYDRPAATGDSAKEPYIPTKEPYIPAQEPYIPAKEPYVPAKESCLSEKEPYIPAKSPTYPQKSPAYVHTSVGAPSVTVLPHPIFPQKSPTYVYIYKYILYMYVYIHIHMSIHKCIYIYIYVGLFCGNICCGKTSICSTNEVLSSPQKSRTYRISGEKHSIYAKKPQKTRKSAGKEPCTSAHVSGYPAYDRLAATGISAKEPYLSAKELCI